MRMHWGNVRLPFSVQAPPQHPNPDSRSRNRWQHIHQLAFKFRHPHPKDGRNENQKQTGAGTKYGMTAPSIIREESFVMAIPSSLLEDRDTISSARMIPCKAPVRDSQRIDHKDSAESRNTGSNVAVTAKAARAGSPIRDTETQFALSLSQTGIGQYDRPVLPASPWRQ